MSSKHLSFGKYEISIPRLKENILSVRTNKKNSAMPPIIITDTVRDLLLDYRDHEKFNITNYNKLQPHNKEVMDRLLKQSGMDDVLGIRISHEEMGHLLERYELLKGAVLGGNDSIEVRKELKQVVLKLVKLGKLPLKQSHTLLLELALLE